MIKVSEEIFRAGDEIPDNLETWKVNAIYHPPKGDNCGYYIVDFETVCISLKTAVKRFMKGCKADPELSKKCHDVIVSDFSDWYEWFSEPNAKNMFKPIDIGGQQVMVEVNEYDGRYKSYYLSALLFEEV